MEIKQIKTLIEKWTRNENESHWHRHEHTGNEDKPNQSVDGDMNGLEMEIKQIKTLIKIWAVNENESQYWQRHEKTGNQKKLIKALIVIWMNWKWK